MNRSSGFFWGAVLLVLGLLFLMENLDMLSVEQAIRTYWPALIIFWGVHILLSGRSGRKNGRKQKRWKFPSSGSVRKLKQPFGDIRAEVPEPNVAVESITGSQSLVFTSPGLQRVAASAILGDVRLDLRQASPDVNGGVVKISGVFGNVVVHVPPGYPVTLAANSLLGSVDAGGEHRDGFASLVKFESHGFTEDCRGFRISVSSVLGDIAVFHQETGG
jgi:predicted membrane protein